MNLAENHANNRRESGNGKDGYRFHCRQDVHESLHPLPQDKRTDRYVANEFIRKVKCAREWNCWMSGQYTISEIAYMIGFSSVAYFRQCFKDEYGMSPSDYVKQKQ